VTVNITPPETAGGFKRLKHFSYPFKTNQPLIILMALYLYFKKLNGN